MGQGNNDKKYTKRGITPEKIIAYLESKAGRTNREVGADLDINKSTVSRWNGEVDEFIKSSPQYQEVAPRIAAMIPKALLVYEDHLNGRGTQGNPDVRVADRVMQIIGILIDKKELKVKPAEMSDEDIIRNLGEIIESGIDGQPEGAGDNVDNGIETPEDGGTEPILPADDAASE